MKNILFQLTLLLSLSLLIGCQGGFDDPIDSKREIGLCTALSSLSVSESLAGKLSLCLLT